MGGCYDIRVAPGGGVCRDARDGACVRHAEENKTDKTSAKMIRAGAGDTCPKVDNDSSQETGKCKNTKCDVMIGGNSYCSQCSKPSDHLVDGKCVATSGDTGCTSQDVPNGTCKSCGDGYFMYQGGCYSVDASKPGHALCTTAPAGVCTAAAAGYFIPPGATKTDQSVVACGDATTGVTVDTNKKYVGVDGCSKCSAPQTIQEPNGGTVVATCSECSNSKIVKTDNGVTSCVTEKECTGTERFFVKGQDDPKTCEACTSPCVACTGQATHCTKCDSAGETPYLRDNSCVNKAGCTSGDTHYADEAAKECKLCADGGLRDCSTCEISNTQLVCKACADGDKNKFGLRRKSCVAKCPDNASEKSGVCTCNDGFTPSTDSIACVVASSSSNLSTGAIAGISVTKSSSTLCC